MIPYRVGYLILILVLCAGCAPVDVPRPNVIVLFSDQHRWHSMGHTELPELETPQMDRIAANGVSFNQTISNYPLCSPFRSMLIAGRWPYETGVIGNGYPLQESEPTIAKAFKATGYETGYVGKWHLQGNTAEPFGFDYSVIWKNSNNHFGGSWKLGGGIEQGTNAGHYNATVMTDQALAFIEQNKARPFFLMVSWNPPHWKFNDAPGKKQALYPEGTLPYRDNHEKDGRNLYSRYRGYHAHISAIDDELGRVFAKLAESDLLKRTIVIYTSDHGATGGPTSIGRKRFPQEESIRVPFLVSGPGVRKRKGAIEPLFGAIDMVPTIAGLAGVEPLPGWSGRDFSPWLRGKRGADPAYQPIMHLVGKDDEPLQPDEQTAPIYRGVRTRRWTYAVSPSEPWLLFDNESDPFQRNNLADDPSHADTRNRLADYIEAWMKEAGDPESLPTNAWL